MATMKRIETDALVIDLKCDNCGKDHPCYGLGANINRSMMLAARGDDKAATKSLGKWFCGKCIKKGRAIYG